MSKKEIRNSGRRKLRASRLSKGLCIHCGKRRHRINLMSCGRCGKHKYEITKRYVDKYPEKVKEYRRKIKGEVISKYGGYCKCCKETRVEFLTIDHINSDGAMERKALFGSQSGSSNQWYLKLRREDKRSDLQVLCFNCNVAKFIYGKCPHELESRA